MAANMVRQPAEGPELCVVTSITCRSPDSTRKTLKGNETKQNTDEMFISEHSECFTDGLIEDKMSDFVFVCQENKGLVFLAKTPLTDGFFHDYHFIEKETEAWKGWGIAQSRQIGVRFKQLPPGPTGMLWGEGGHTWRWGRAWEGASRWHPWEVMHVGLWGAHCSPLPPNVNPGFSTSWFSALRAWPWVGEGGQISLLLVESFCLTSLCPVGPEKALLRPSRLYSH